MEVGERGQLHLPDAVFLKMGSLLLARCLGEP